MERMDITEDYCDAMLAALDAVDRCDDIPSSPHRERIISELVAARVLLRTKDGLCIDGDTAAVRSLYSSRMWVVRRFDEIDRWQINSARATVRNTRISIAAIIIAAAALALSLLQAFGIV